MIGLPVRARALVISALILILVIATAAVTSARPLQPRDATDKIAPWVLAHTADGAQAEFLVVLADQADLSAADKLPTKIEKGRYVYQTLFDKAQATQGPILKWLEERGIEHRAYYIVNLIWVKADRATALALAARSDVARLDGNPQVRAITDPPPGPIDLAAPDGPNAVEPGINYTKAPQVWAMGFTGQGVVVGGQDTGIQWDHPALKNHYRGWNGTTASHDYNWHDSIHTNSHGTNVCGINSTAPCDDDSHGTHTMGTAVGSDGAANQIGMAPGAKFIGCRNMDNGYGTPATYLECFEFFLAPYPVGGTPAQGNPDLAPDVTNNSWGCPPSEGCVVNSLLAAVQAQRAAGIMTVASAGNSGPACSTTDDPPSYHDEVYTVGALSTGTDTIASFSSRGPVDADGSGRLKPDISAPGTSTRSSIPGNTYGSMSGTSMASPHVAGAVALLWSARPQLKNNIDLTEQVLNQSAAHINNSTCDPAGTTWPNNTYGYGRLDIKAAVDAVPVNNSTLAGVVTNAVTAVPVANAAITATASITLTGSTTTGASGAYTLPLINGTYTVDAAAYGYHPAQITGVSLISGTTTTLNIALTPTLFYTVSGTVKDALTGQPLSATIAITGFPGSPVIADANGHYAVSLAEGVAYTFGVTAKVNGYGSIVRSIGPLTADRIENFNLAPDLAACRAPGYTLFGVSESFSSGITPTNWIVSGTAAGWRFNNPGGWPNQTGGTGGMAIADSDYFGMVSMNTELRTPAMNLSSVPSVTLRFKTHFTYFGGEVADVDVSADGGATWANVWRRTASVPGPSAQEVDVSSQAAGQSAVMVRFHYYDAFRDGYWQIDDVQLGYCAPPNFSRPVLSPELAAKSGQPGTEVTYDLILENASDDTHAYTLTAQAVWPTLLSTTALTMTPHMTSTLTVSVKVPITIEGRSDTAAINLIGSNGMATSLLTTTAHWPYAFYLPLTIKE